MAPIFSESILLCVNHVFCSPAYCYVNVTS